MSAAPLASASLRALMTAASRSRSGLSAIDARHPGHSGEAGVSPENAHSGAFGLAALSWLGAVEHPATKAASRARNAIRRMANILFDTATARWPARRDARRMTGRLDSTRN